MGCDSPAGACTEQKSIQLGDGKYLSPIPSIEESMESHTGMPQVPQMEHKGATFSCHLPPRANPEAHNLEAGVVMKGGFCRTRDPPIKYPLLATNPLPALLKVTCPDEAKYLSGHHLTLILSTAS